MKRTSALILTLVFTAIPMAFFQNCASDVTYSATDSLDAACSFANAPVSLNRTRAEEFQLKLENIGTATWNTQGLNAPSLILSEGTDRTTISPPSEVLPGESWLVKVTTTKHLAVNPNDSLALEWILTDPQGMPVGQPCKKSFTVTGPPDFDSAIEKTELKSPMRKSTTEAGTYRFRNTGLKPWVQGSVKLPIQNRNFELPMAEVKPGESVEFVVDVLSPNSAGPFDVTASLIGPGGQFGAQVTTKIAIDDASGVPNSPPKFSGALLENQQYDVVVTMLNTGSSTWIANQYFLTELVGSANWQMGSYSVRQDTPPGASHQFPVRVTTPTVAAGTCAYFSLKAQMKNQIRGYHFGEVVSFKADNVDSSGQIQVCGKPVGDFTYGPWGPLILFQVGGQTYGKQERTESCTYTGGCRNPQPKTQYVNSWSTVAGPCSVTCGGGTQSLSSTPLTWTYTANGAPKPPDSQSCNAQACPIRGPYSYGPWSSTILYPLANGTHAKQTRSESCGYPDGCYDQQPTIRYAESWSVAWLGNCSVSCGGGTETGVASPLTWTYTPEGAVRPAESRACNIQRCPTTGPWSYGPWGATQFFPMADGTHAKQVRSESCNYDTCTDRQPTEQFVSAWVVNWNNNCTVACGGGTETGVAMATQWSYTPSGAPAPAATRSCNIQACPPQCPSGQVLVNGVCQCQGYVPDSTGCLKATCTGFNSSPKVHLNWCNNASNPPTYSLQKGDQNWGTGTYYWWMDNADPYATSFTDYDGYPARGVTSRVQRGVTYGYRTKCNTSSSTTCTVRTLQVEINSCFCSP